MTLMGDRASLSVNELGSLVKSKREREGLGLREAASQAEVSFNTLSRVERGHVPDIETFRRIVAWLGLSPDRFFGPSRRRWDPTPEVIAEHLNADPNLPPEAAEKIAALVHDLYTNLARKENLTLHLRAARTFVPEAATSLGRLLEDIQEALLAEDSAT